MLYGRKITKDERGLPSEEQISPLQENEEEPMIEQDLSPYHPMPESVVLPNRKAAKMKKNKEK